MTRIDRLFSILLFLQSRRVTRAEDIAVHFETSIRTVYRDIAALGEAGVPIMAEAGVGYALMKGFHLQPVSFTAEEASALATGGLLVRQFADPSTAGHMASALLKIRAVLPRDKQQQIERLEESMATLAPRATDPNAFLTDIQRALSERVVVRIDYRRARDTEITAREIEPLGLIFYLDKWHLIAWCRMRQDYRDFRTDRIQRIDLTREKCEPRSDFSLSRFIETHLHPEKSRLARVKFAPTSADRARREWSLGVRREEVEADGVVMTLATGEWSWIAGWLLSFGTCAVVLDPPELRATVALAAAEAARHHGSG